MVALGLQFKDVAATTKELPVKSLLTVDVPKTGTGANGLTDQIHVWTGMAWKKYYNRKNVGWVAVDQADLTVETDDKVKVGDGIFFKRPGSAAANLTLAGEVVVNDATASIDVGKGKMVFIAYPWPVALPIANFQNNVDVPKAGTGANGLTDQVHVWTGMAWKKYFHSKSLAGYVAVDEPSVLTEDSITAGTCFFFKRPGSANATLTFTKPAGL